MIVGTIMANLFGERRCFGNGLWLLLAITLLGTLRPTVASADLTSVIYAISADKDQATVEKDDKSEQKNYYWEVAEDKKVTFRVVGRGLQSGQRITFTTKAEERGSKCVLGTHESDFLLKDVDNSRADYDTATFSFGKLPASSNHAPFYYLCLKSGDVPLTTADPSNSNSTLPSITKLNNNDTSTTTSFYHQGQGIRIKSKARLLPLWLQIIFIAVLLVLSGLFSGLNLGLMSLDPTELIIVQNSGSDSEKKFAKSIAPVRKRGNFLLCTLLLGNVLVNSTTTILLDDVGGGLVAVIASTICIVIFGEIVPQAICSRHGLAVGAKTIWITKIFMVLTFPLAFPLSKLLDVILGDELGQVYSREKLAELIKLGADKEDIKHDELNIIEGALQLTKKSAVDVMTAIDDVYMVEYSATLDFETMTDILHTGYTRVPVFEESRLNIVALLNVKDLAFVDPDDKIPLKTVCKFYNHPITFVFEDTRLDQLLEEFKKGQSHMAFVQRVVEDGKSDPYYDVLGIVTLEDIIEEIIQCEILDETDIITDNQTKRRRHNIRRKDFSVFNQPTDSHRVCMSPQLMLATFQYLQTTVEPFKEEYISGNILKRLLKQDIFVQLKYDEKSIDSLLYIATKPADYFIIILQGKCSVEIGKDHLRFEAGPFYSFGAEALVVGGLTCASQYDMLAKRSSQCNVLAARKSQPNALASLEPEFEKIANKDAFSSNSASNLNDLVYSKGHVYVPDFTVKALTDVEFVRVKRHQYIAAQRATMMERQPTTPRGPTDSPPVEDPFSAEWKRANQASQHHCEEGTLPPYLRQHQRNYSSGNLEELRHRRDLKLSPLISNSVHVDNGPTRTIIYPENHNPASRSSDHEKVHLLPNARHTVNFDVRNDDS